MVRYGIWVTFLLAVQLSSVFGRNQYYEYYYNKYHHKSHSTTTALSSSTAEISTEHKISPSVSGDDDDSLESSEHSSTVDVQLTQHKNRTSHSYGYNEYDGETKLALTYGVVFGSLIAVFTVGSCCLYCCIRTCRRRNAVRRGFIIADRTPASGAFLQSVVGHHRPQQQAVPNQYPPQYHDERAHLFPPQHQPQESMQRPQQPTYQSQYSPQQLPYQSHYSPQAPQDHNPPEAPPPYEFPEKF